MEAATSSPCPEIAAVIVPAASIRRRVAELAEEITQAAGPAELTVLGVLEGAIFFLADLLRRLPMPVRVLTVGVRSYPGRATTPAQIEFSHRITESLRGRDVLIVDDILDSGATLAAVRDEVSSHGPSSCRICVLLRKQRPRAGSAGGEADYVGFDIPNVFVVGYGLDFDGRFRNLPDIVALKQHWKEPP